MQMLHSFLSSAAAAEQSFHTAEELIGGADLGTWIINCVTMDVTANMKDES